MIACLHSSWIHHLVVQQLAVILKFYLVKQPPRNLLFYGYTISYLETIRMVVNPWTILHYVTNYLTAYNSTTSSTSLYPHYP